MPNCALPGLAILNVVAITRRPVDLSFWRPANTTVNKRRNPIFAETLGVTIQSFALDVSHALNSG
eukprot:2188207-Lingulodinium_polyedra.AAC.1